MAVPWKITDAPADFIDGLLRVIVGIEIPIATLTGKWKVSQNCPEPMTSSASSPGSVRTAMPCRPGDGRAVRQHIPSNAEG
jgi:hypothetical protein